MGLNLEHPSITRILLIGYPDTYQEEYEPDEDAAYEEKLMGKTRILL